MHHLKRLAAVALFFLLSPAAARAAQMALVYEGDAAVTAGKSVPAPVTDTGVIVPASTALTQASTMLIGDADGLFHAVLFRLDNDLNVAILRRGDAVKDPQLVGRHLHRWSAAAAFVSGEAASLPPAGAAPAVAVSSGPFGVTINGAGPDTTVVLKERFNKAKFTLTVVNTSTVPVWAISVRLSSDPKLSFWKEGRRSGLNEVPEPVLTYDQQTIIKPIAPGQSISVTAEAYYMKGKDYTWTAQARSKALFSENKFAVRIE